MADGIVCKYCGWEETDHDLRVSAGNSRDEEQTGRHVEELAGANDVITGYVTSLNRCLGYSPENPALAEEYAREDYRRRIGPYADPGFIGD